MREFEDIEDISRRQRSRKKVHWIIHRYFHMPMRI